MTDSARVEAFKRQLEELRAEYRRGLPDSIARIGALWNTLESGSARPAAMADVLRELRRELHTLAGTARTMGVTGVSEAAAAAESFLERFEGRGAAAESGARAELARLLLALQQSAAES